MLRIRDLRNALRESQRALREIRHEVGDIRHEVGELRREASELPGLRQELADLREQNTALSAKLDQHEAIHRDMHHQRVMTSQGFVDHLQAATDRTVAAVRAAAEDPVRARRDLAALRAGEAYAAAYTDADPLVSILIPTYDNHAGLRERSIPSALGQTHEHVEVIVVGDVSPTATAEVIGGFDDARLRFENLTQRGPYPDREPDFWFTAGTYPLNRAFALASGQWIAVLNDDDAYRPDCIAKLLELARTTNAEVAYGRSRYHHPDEAQSWDHGTFPPELHHFGWQQALQHAGLRCFEFELFAPAFGEPGDWNRARRMLEAGVRFSMTDEIVADYWPSKLWKDAAA